MSLPDAFQAFLAAGIGVIAAALLFVWWTRATAAPAVAARRLLADSAGKTALIFAGDRLVDATPEGRALLRQAREGSTDWDRLVSALAPRFPDLRRQCADLAMTGRESIAADNDPDTLVEATYLDGVVRLELRAGAARTDPAERLIVAAMEQELTLLRNIGDNAPQLIWQCDRDGQVTWANRAYLDLADRAFPAEGDTTLTWPPPDLFSDLPLPEDSAPVVEHNWLSSAGTIAPRCYEITSVHRDPGTMHYAVDITEVVEAREDQKTFVQTLTKTFAQLSVGLAIFDRARRLTLFNPALTDMLGLPTDFLVSRPHIGPFLDRLREARMIPEPKDYAAWCAKVEAVEAAADDDRYQEAWTLPNGQTYRVTGRPHPDGALAFLFEDISEELSLTRRFRAQIEMGQEILHSMEEAAVAFSATGEVVMSNRAYRLLWGSEGHLGLGGAHAVGRTRCLAQQNGANTGLASYHHRAHSLRGHRDAARRTPLCAALLRPLDRAPLDPVHGPGSCPGRARAGPSGTDGLGLVAAGKTRSLAQWQRPITTFFWPARPTPTVSDGRSPRCCSPAMRCCCGAKLGRASLPLPAALFARSAARIPRCHRRPIPLCRPTPHRRGKSGTAISTGWGTPRRRWNWACTTPSTGPYAWSNGPTGWARTCPMTRCTSNLRLGRRATVPACP